MAVIAIQAAGRIRATVGGRQGPCPCKIVAAEQRVERGIGLQRAHALRRIGDRRERIRTTVGIQANRVCARIDQPESVSLRDDGVLIRHARLDVVHTPDVGHAGARAEIGKPAILADGLGLQIRNQVREGISARVIVVLILPHEAAERKYGVRVEQAGPGRRNVKRADLRTLVGRAHRHTVRSKPSVIRHQPGPCSCVLGVERIRRLEPRPGEAEVHVDTVRLRRLEVDAIEEILFIASVVHDGEFRSVQKAAALEAAGGDEVAPPVAAVREVEAAAASAEAAVGSVDFAMRLSDAQAGSRGHHDYQAGLVAVFGRRCAFDHFHRRHRIERNLIRENLALLVGDGLVVHRK